MKGYEFFSAVTSRRRSHSTGSVWSPQSRIEIVNRPQQRRAGCSDEGSHVLRQAPPIVAGLVDDHRVGTPNAGVGNPDLAEHGEVRTELLCEQVELSHKGNLRGKEAILHVLGKLDGAGVSHKIVRLGTTRLAVHTQN